MKGGEFYLHVRADIGRILTVAVTNVGVPSPRGELLARKGVIIIILSGSVVAAVLANIRKRNRDLFALERDLIFVVLPNRISICVSFQIFSPPPFFGFATTCVELFEMGNREGTYIAHIDGGCIITMHTITLTAVDFVVVASEFVVQFPDEVSGFGIIRIGIFAADYLASTTSRLLSLHKRHGVIDMDVFGLQLGGFLRDQGRD